MDLPNATHPEPGTALRSSCACSIWASKGSGHRPPQDTVRLSDHYAVGRCGPYGRCAAHPLPPSQGELHQLALANPVASQLREMFEVGVPFQQLVPHDSSALDSKPPIRDFGIQDDVLTEDVRGERYALDSGQDPTGSVVPIRSPPLAGQPFTYESFWATLPSRTRNTSTPRTCPPSQL